MRRVGIGTVLARQFLTEGARLVVGLGAPTLDEFRHHKVNEIGSGSRGDRVGEIEPIDSAMVDPALEQVGDRLRTADRHGAETADAALPDHVPHGPRGAVLGVDEGFQRRAQ